MRDLLTTLLELGGAAALVAAGFLLAGAWLALALAGVMALAASWLIERDAR